MTTLETIITLLDPAKDSALYDDAVSAVTRSFLCEGASAAREKALTIREAYEDVLLAEFFSTAV